MDFDFLSDNVKRLKPSATLAVAAKANELKASGKDVIDMAVGEPDFDTPENIKQAAIKAINNGETKYTPVDGTKALKSAIKEKFLRENDLEFDPSQIMVSCGAKQVLFNALLASVNSGDEVIIPAPYWVSYPEMVSFAGGIPVFIKCTQAKGFKLTAEDLDRAITSRTKWLILCSPSNPTGAAYTKEELLEIGRVLNKHPHVMIMCDDIYEHLIYGSSKFITLAQLFPEMRSRILIVNGVSKAYCMTGWRIGYGAGNVNLIKSMTKVQSQSTSNPCSISQAASVEALLGTQEFLPQMKQKFMERRDIFVKHLNEIKGIECLTPDGAFYVYPSCAGLIGKSTKDGKILNSDEDVVKFLLEHALVAGVHGGAFGLSPHFRLSYATKEELIIEACNRIKKAVDELI